MLSDFQASTHLGKERGDEGDMKGNTMMKNKRTLVLALIVSVFCCVAQAAEPIGQIRVIQGSAYAISADGTIRTLDVYSEIFLNDTVKTDPLCELEIIFKDETMFAQSGSSEMTIEEYIFNPNQASDNAFCARLGQGMYRTITGKITDLNPERFAIKTSRSTIGVHGTEVAIEIGSNEDVITVLSLSSDESVFVNSNNGNVEEIGENESATVNDAGDVTTQLIDTAIRTELREKTTSKKTEPLNDPPENALSDDDKDQHASKT